METKTNTINQAQDIIIHRIGEGKYRLFINPKGKADRSLPNEMGLRTFANTSPYSTSGRVDVQYSTMDVNEKELIFLLKASNSERQKLDIKEANNEFAEYDQILKKAMDLGLFSESKEEFGGQTSNPLIIGAIRRIVLTVSNVDQSLVFYRDLLGLRAQKLASGEIEVGPGETTLLLQEKEKQDLRQAYIVFSIPFNQFQNAIKRLRLQNINFNDPVERIERNEIAVQFSDPDGNVIELTTFKTVQEDQNKIWSTITGTWSSITLSEKPENKLPKSDNHHYGFEGKTHWYREELDPLLQDILYGSVPIPSRILEVGCGYGFIAARLAALGYEVLAVDIDRVGIKLNKELFQSVNPRLEFKQTNITDSLEQYGQFDLVLDQGCSQGFAPELFIKYLNNIFEVLKDKGLFIITTRSSLDVTSAFSRGKWNAQDLVRTCSRHFIPRYQTIYTQFGSTATYNKEKRLLIVFERREKIFTASH